MNEDLDNYYQNNFVIGDWGFIPKEWIWEICSFLFPIDYMKLIWMNSHWYHSIRGFASHQEEFRFTKFIFDRIMLSSCKYSHQKQLEKHSEMDEGISQEQYSTFLESNRKQVHSLFNLFFTGVRHWYFSDLFIEKELITWCLGSDEENPNNTLESITFFNCKLECGLAQNIANSTSNLREINLPYSGFCDIEVTRQKNLRFVDSYQSQFMSFLLFQNDFSSIEKGKYKTKSIDHEKKQNRVEDDNSHILGNIDILELLPFFNDSTNKSFETLKYIYLEAYDGISESHISQDITQTHGNLITSNSDDREFLQRNIFKKNNQYFTWINLPDTRNKRLEVPLELCKVGDLDHQLKSVIFSNADEEGEEEFGRRKTPQDLIYLAAILPSHINLICFCGLESFKTRSDSIDSYFECVGFEKCYGKTSAPPCVLLSSLQSNKHKDLPTVFLKLQNNLRKRNKTRKEFSLVNYYGIENHSGVYGHIHRLTDVIIWGDIQKVDYLLNMGFHIHDLLYFAQVNSALYTHDDSSDTCECYLSDLMFSIVFFGIVHRKGENFLELLGLLTRFGMEKLFGPLLNVWENNYLDVKLLESLTLVDLLIVMKLYKSMLSFSMMFPVIKTEFFVKIDSDEHDHEIRDMLDLDLLESNLKDLWTWLFASIELLMEEFWNRVYKKKSSLIGVKIESKREQPVRMAKIIKRLEKGDSAMFDQAENDLNELKKDSLWNFFMTVDHSYIGELREEEEWSGVLESEDFDWINYCDNPDQASRIGMIMNSICMDQRFESPILSASLNCNEDGIRFLLEKLPPLNVESRTERFTEWLNEPRFHDTTNRTVTLYDVVESSYPILRVCDLLCFKPVVVAGMMLIYCHDDNESDESIDYLSLFKSLLADIYFETGSMRDIPDIDMSLTKFISKLDVKKKSTPYSTTSVSEDRRLSTLIYLTEIGCKTVSSRRGRSSNR
ncbi:predicted protein [Naegleria gruberi]|uniref:Predicted protein n=1 Tax=Naegleria gruberi TaxID=5762 RepID=D2V915_NAEGR|nr:uncharacterized protein NAEGRDRAFT_47638 [Naegleria gruberi]EFC46787.1 predicted protein [Naegleria gruberi]|eukprot:XP_002679531.1 predicted protein [Naegleria gruberi strain NEG-M]